MSRLRHAWSQLQVHQRRVALAATLVLVSMLLPWYSKTTSAITRNGLERSHEAKMALTVPSFVEASIFVVAIAVLALLFARGDGRAFHLPFGDGAVISAAGAWTGLLIFYRFVDQPSGGASKNLAFDYGLSWGIFFGLLAAAFLLYSGLRLGAAHVPEPPNPAEDPPTRRAPAAAPTSVAPVLRHSRPEIDGGEQLSFDEQERE